MIEDQKQQIRLMRYQGIGYKKIAETLGLSRDSVRGYCKRNQINGLGADLAEKHEQDLIKKMTYVYCLQCGSKLEQPKRGRRKKYCSIDCKRAWEETHPTIYKLQCDYCRKEYVSGKTKNRQFCSNDCYTGNRFYREEDAAKIFDKIIKREKIEFLPKWLEELLLSYLNGH